MHWAAVVFGWPAALTAILLSGLGFTLHRPLLVWLGAFVAVPFMLYLFAAPRFWLLAAVAAPCHFGAAVALGRRMPLLAWLLFAPTPSVIAFVAATVTTASVP